MCLLIIAHRVSPDYPLVVAANRDEFHARPTAVSQFWPEHPDLLAGKDLQAGGTWMGVTREGRFAAITNYRDPGRSAPAPRSRGELPLQFLAGNLAPQQFLQDIAAQATDYAGFNLLLGDGEQLWYLTNSLPQHECEPLCLAPGVYGLSNARLDTAWPKVSLGKQQLCQLLESGAFNHDQLLQVVGDRRLADIDDLHPHGLAGEMDQLLSAQFIVTQQYGTRSSTSLWTDSDGHSSWRELSFDERGQVREVQEINFSRA